MDNFENSRINESGLSQDADAKTICLLENDPIEEIFALNLGDFLCEHLISPDFAHKIGDKVKTKNERLKDQLTELISIYSIEIHSEKASLSIDSIDDGIITWDKFLHFEKRDFLIDII